MVEDVETEVKRLVSNGAKIAAKQFDDWRSTLAYVEDPDGIWIELIGKKKKKQK
ncbi:MAG: VOC family protein [Candidatus Marsarchaeota archaeon]|jgi:predicted enzyme related to lactoylglutathione lyase|nr:VOC family protein [Candidatus Marsarchaeota archaeon]MCL5112004.1 VOC family protein [Candidatus Marsarchaeota archaeon]